MKDEAYVFYEDVKEKSIVARGAHKRPNRRKSRMPDYTTKEMKAMNGQVNSINLNAAITYEHFKTLPEGLKKEYIQNLISKYDAGPTEIAHMLGMGVKNCSVQLRKLGFGFNRGHRQSKENKERMRADYGVASTAAAPTKKKKWLCKMCHLPFMEPSTRANLPNSLARLFQQGKRFARLW